jgi:hypothetical protein
MIMFEIENYCQVISRTWSPQLTGDGWPLLLECPAADEQPECVIRTTVAALCLPVLPSWQPRNPDQEDDGRAAGAYAAPPEYWLPQLAQRKRVVARNSTGKRWVAGQLPLWLPNETVFRHGRHWLLRSTIKTVSGAGGARAHDWRIMRSPARRSECANCMDTTELYP